MMTLKSTAFAAALAGLGFVMTAGAGSATTNLISNGDFSAGSADWTVSSNAYYFDGSGYHEGAYHGATGYLSQTFSDSAGKSLTLAFDYQGKDGTSFQYVVFDGHQVAGSNVSGVTGYNSYSFTLGAGTGSDTLTFVGQNQPSYNTLDHVSVTAVPEISTWAMMLAGFAGLGFVGYGRNKVVGTFAA